MIQGWCIEMEETAFTVGSFIFCQRMTHIFAQDAFFNKVHMRKTCLARRRLHSKDQRRNELRDSFSVPELDRLIEMNYPVRRGWSVVRRLK